jgi:hypothetical protein
MNTKQGDKMDTKPGNKMDTEQKTDPRDFDTKVSRADGKSFIARTRWNGNSVTTTFEEICD